MDIAKVSLEFSSLGGMPGLDDAREYAKELLTPYGTVTISPLGSVVCVVKEPKEGQPHILLDAHIDEIGLMASYIEDNGFIRVGQFGGTDARLLAASRVIIHTSTGDINGVICSTPPHLNTDGDNKAQPADKIYVDTGLSTEKAKELITPGDRITFESLPAEMLNGYIVNKALDDRAGCVCLLSALEHLGNDFDCGLTVVFSEMEEIGGMGARTTSYSVAPTHALAVDVSFGDAPDVSAHKSIKMSGGPAIGIAPILDHKVSTRLAELAKENEIPYQLEVMGGRTGTNCDSIVTSRGGVKTALISLPLRNMHMPIEMINTQDIDNIGKLIAVWIKDTAERGAK